MAVEVRKGKMGMRYVRDEDLEWNSVWNSVWRKRKKNAGCVGDGELRVDGGRVACTSGT